MSEFKWNIEKNLQLKNNPDRAICFEDIVSAIENGGLLDDIEHQNSTKYPHQRIYVVLCNDYIYSVPYVRDEGGIFLKTIYPSRKLTGVYAKGKDNEN